MVSNAGGVKVKVKVKVGFLYSAAYAMAGPARFTISEVAVDWVDYNLAISQKRRKSGTWLLRKANSYTPYLMAPFPVTLTSPNYPKPPIPVTSRHCTKRGKQN